MEGKTNNTSFNCFHGKVLWGLKEAVVILLVLPNHIIIMRKLMKYCLSLAVCQIIYSSRRRCAKYMCKISNFRITVINLNNFSLLRNLYTFLFSFTTFTVEIFKIYVYFHCSFQVKKYCFLDPCCIYIRYILRDACVHVRYVPLDNF